MKKPVVIFDLDGTLIDPSTAICRSINYALKEKGHSEVSHEMLYKYIGRHLIDPFRDITGIADEEFLWSCINSYRDRYETVGIAENKLYPGIKEMFKVLDTANYLASIKPAHACRMVLKELGIEDHFSGVYGGELDGTRCDKSELLKYLSDEEGIKNAVMVGDRDTDIKAAKECGFVSVGAVYGYGSREELKEAGADYLVEKPEDLLDVLKNICRS